MLCIGFIYGQIFISHSRCSRNCHQRQVSWIWYGLKSFFSKSVWIPSWESWAAQIRWEPAAYLNALGCTRPLGNCFADNFGVSSHKTSHTDILKTLLVFFQGVVRYDKSGYSTKQRSRWSSVIVKYYQKHPINCVTCLTSRLNGHKWVPVNWYWLRTRSLQWKSVVNCKWMV